MTEIQTLLEIFNQKLHPSTTPAAAEQARSALTVLTAGTGFFTLDVEDLQFALDAPGAIATANACASGAERAKQAAEQALAAIVGVELGKASGLIILFTAGSREKFQFRECKDALDVVSKHCSEELNIQFGAHEDSGLGDDICVTLIFTGLPQV